MLLGYRLQFRVNPEFIGKQLNVLETTSILTSHPGAHQRNLESAIRWLNIVGQIQSKPIRKHILRGSQP